MGVFYQPYQWDMKTNFLWLHRKLTSEHFLYLYLKDEKSSCGRCPDFEHDLTFSKNIRSPSLTLIFLCHHWSARSSLTIHHIIWSHEPISAITGQQDYNSTKNPVSFPCIQKKDNSDRKQNFMTSESFQYFYSYIKGLINVNIGLQWARLSLLASSIQTLLKICSTSNVTYIVVPTPIQKHPIPNTDLFNSSNSFIPLVVIRVEISTFFVT